jgi:hypothetical protein
VHVSGNLICVGNANPGLAALKRDPVERHIQASHPSVGATVPDGNLVAVDLEGVGVSHQPVTKLVWVNSETVLSPTIQVIAGTPPSVKTRKQHL